MYAFEAPAPPAAVTADRRGRRPCARNSRRPSRARPRGSCPAPPRRPRPSIRARRGERSLGSTDLREHGELGCRSARRPATEPGSEQLPQTGRITGTSAQSRPGERIRPVRGHRAVRDRGGHADDAGRSCALPRAPRARAARPAPGRPRRRPRDPVVGGVARESLGAGEIDAEAGDVVRGDLEADRESSVPEAARNGTIGCASAPAATGSPSVTRLRADQLLDELETVGLVRFVSVARPARRWGGAVCAGRQSTAERLCSRRWVDCTGPSSRARPCSSSSASGFVGAPGCAGQPMRRLVTETY